MSLQSDLIQFLGALNTAAGERVFHEQIDQGISRPVMATTELTGSRPMDLSGRGLLNRSTIRLAIFANKAEQTESIAKAVTSAFSNGYRGMMGSTQISSVRVETSSDEVALSDGDTIIKGKGLDLFFVYY